MKIPLKNNFNMVFLFFLLFCCFLPNIYCDIYCYQGNNTNYEKVLCKHDLCQTILGIDDASFWTYTCSSSDDLLETYKKVLSSDPPFYYPLLLCLYEEYRISGLERIVRCFCSGNFCNMIDNKWLGPL